MLITFKDEAKGKKRLLEFRKHVTYSPKGVMINWNARQLKMNEKLIWKFET